VAVFLYTSPVFSALVLHLLPGELLRPFQWLGIAVCFTGIAVAFIGGTTLAHLDARILLGDALAVRAGLAWGITTVAVRASRLSEAPTALTLFYQMAVAFVLLLGLALVMGKMSHVTRTPIMVGGVLFQGLMVSFASYLVWFWMLRCYLASNLAVLSFMTPLFGVTLGVLIRDEPLTVNFVLGAVLVGARRHRAGQRKGVAAPPAYCAAPASPLSVTRARPESTLTVRDTVLPDALVARTV
jgi:drug/metabolite transporter (DMT)-like permease